MSARTPAEWHEPGGDFVQTKAILAACRSGSVAVFERLYISAAAPPRPRRPPPPLSYCLYLATTVSRWPPLVAAILRLDETPPQDWSVARRDSEQEAGLTEERIEEYVLYSILSSISRGDVKLVQVFLDAGLHIDTTLTYRYDRSEGFLQRAVTADQATMVQYLIGQGADVNTELLDGGEPFTPVSLAARHNLPGILRLLVSEGVGGKLVGSWALWHAAIDGSMDAAEALLDLGVDVNEVFIMNIEAGDTADPEENAGTALHAAASTGKADFIEWLLVKGATVHVKNGQGQTALEVSIDEGHMDIAALLRAAQ